MTEADKQTVREALDKAKQLALIADDWNLDEVEMDGEMVATYSLVKVFDSALAAVESVDEAVPWPDWSGAPDWAQWWAVDPNGWAHWFQEEPVLCLTATHSGWVAKTINAIVQGAELWAAEIDIPLGTDWRTLVRRRA